jgi:hypothetical protein
MNGRGEASRGRKQTRYRRGPGAKIAGIRWVPVPLAVLAAVVGWLVFGSLQGQSAASGANQHGFEAGGLQLTVQQMVWMSNDMTGQGPLKLPKGFPMDPGMMSGMQSTNDDRLHMAVTFQNVTSTMQSYNLNDFRIVAPNGQSWPIVDDGGNATVNQAFLEPKYNVSADVYFDVPIKQNKNLTIEWSHDGTKVEFPVNTSSAPTAHNH